MKYFLIFLLCLLPFVVFGQYAQGNYGIGGGGATTIASKWGLVDWQPPDNWNTRKSTNPEFTVTSDAAGDSILHINNPGSGIAFYVQLNLYSSESEGITGSDSATHECEIYYSCDDRIIWDWAKAQYCFGTAEACDPAQGAFMGKTVKKRTATSIAIWYLKLPSCFQDSLRVNIRARSSQDTLHCYPMVKWCYGPASDWGNVSHLTLHSTFVEDTIGMWDVTSLLELVTDTSNSGKEGGIYLAAEYLGTDGANFIPVRWRTGPASADSSTAMEGGIFTYRKGKPLVTTLKKTALVGEDSIQVNADLTNWVDVVAKTMEGICLLRHEVNSGLYNNYFCRLVESISVGDSCIHFQGSGVGDTLWEDFSTACQVVLFAVDTIEATTYDYNYAYGFEDDPEGLGFYDGPQNWVVCSFAKNGKIGATTDERKGIYGSLASPYSLLSCYIPLEVAYSGSGEDQRCLRRYWASNFRLANPTLAEYWSCRFYRGYYYLTGAAGEDPVVAHTFTSQQDTTTILKSSNDNWIGVSLATASYSWADLVAANATVDGDIDEYNVDMVCYENGANWECRRAFLSFALDSADLGPDSLNPFGANSMTLRISRNGSVDYTDTLYVYNVTGVSNPDSIEAEWYGSIQRTLDFWDGTSLHDSVAIGKIDEDVMVSSNTLYDIQIEDWAVPYLIQYYPGHGWYVTLAVILSYDANVEEPSASIHRVELTSWDKGSGTNAAELLIYHKVQQ